MNLKKTLLTLGMTASLVLPGVAGNGSYTSKDGRKFLNLTVYFKGAIRASEIDAWKANFTRANEILYRATLGQIQLGDIRFSTDAFSESRADLVIPRKGHAHVAGLVKGTALGSKGQLFMYTDDDLDGPLTTVHEMGHYVFGLFDEYKGTRYAVNNGVLAEAGDTKADGFEVFCVNKADTDGSHASIMWDSTDTLTLAHFCVKTNHRKQISLGNGRIAQTDHQDQEGRDCWSCIAEYAGITAPTAPPDFDEKPAVAPNFVELGSEALTVYLIQDTTGLTLGTTKKAITDGLNRLRGPKGARKNGDFAGVMTYNADGVKTNLAIREFRTAADRKAAATLVNAINPSQVDDCDVAVALRAARDAMNAEEGKYSTGFAAKTIVLFSDNRGSAGIDDALIDELRQSNIGVNVVELFVSQDDRLKNLSLKTVGRHSPSTFRRPAIKFNGIAAKVDDDSTESDQAQTDVGSGVVGQFRLDGFQGEIDSTTPRTHSVNVDSFVTSVTFQLNSVFNPDIPTPIPLDLEVRDPGGQLIDLTNPPANVDVTSNESDLKSVTISSPSAGSWTCRVSAPGDPGRYALDIFGEGDALVTSNSGDAIKGRFPAATPIQVKIGSEQNIMGAQVTGKVFRPDGTSIDITLFDDGDGAHGDKLANDGIYSALFNDYTGPGDYLVSLSAVGGANAQFTTVNARGDAAGGFTPGPTGPCPPFQREISQVISCLGNTGTGAGLLPLVDVQILAGPNGTVTIRWRNPNGGGVETVIQKASVFGQWTDLVTLPPGATEYTDTSAGLAGQVFYRVLAKSGANLSDPSSFKQMDMALVQQAFQEVAAGGGFSGFNIDNSSGGGFCFIATAAYGSYLDPHVASLRRFRDEQLRPLPGGEKLIETYYKVSPALANYLVMHPWAKAPTRAALTVVVGAVEHPWAASLLLMGGLAGLCLRRRRGGLKSVELV